MKNFLTPFFLLFCLMTISCTTEEVSVEPVTENPEPQPPVNTDFTEENPFPVFLSTTRYNEHVTLCSDVSSFKSVGFKFKTLEKGIINSLTVKIPVINNNLIVTITDAVSNQTIRTEAINVLSANTQTIKTIVPLELEKNKTYYITMRTTNHYKHFRADFSQPQYPVTVGNIKIVTPVTSEFSANGTELGGTGNFCSGDCSFTFLRTE